MDVQLVHHLLPMLLHRLDTDAQVRRDLLVHLSFRHQLQHLEFPGGELLTVAANRFTFEISLPIIIEQALRNGGTEKRVATIGLADRFNQVIGGRLLDEITRRAGLGQLVHVLVVTIRRQHQHLRRDSLFDDLPRGFESVELRHGDVHYDHIRSQGLGHLDRLPTVLRLAHHFDIQFGCQERTQSLPHDRVIVCE